jgi:isopenicillin N synthase-like dioxygenase
MSELSIPVIDVAALFGGPSPARDRTDAAIMEAASTFGFFAAGALPGDVPIDRESRSRAANRSSYEQGGHRPRGRRRVRNRGGAR